MIIKQSLSYTKRKEISLPTSRKRDDVLQRLIEVLIVIINFDQKVSLLGAGQITNYIHIFELEGIRKESRAIGF